LAVGWVKAGLQIKKAVLKENERGDCQVALLLGQVKWRCNLFYGSHGF
jgi:hypothetical protein